MHAVLKRPMSGRADRTNNLYGRYRYRLPDAPFSSGRNPPFVLRCNLVTWRESVQIRTRHELFNTTPAGVPRGPEPAPAYCVRNADAGQSRRSRPVSRVARLYHPVEKRLVLFSLDLRTDAALSVNYCLQWKRRLCVEQFVQHQTFEAQSRRRHNQNIANMAH